MEDIVKSIKAFLYDRASSPLFGALVVTWLTSNYKAILISISDADIAIKIELLDNYFNKAYWNIYLDLLIYQFSFDVPRGGSVCLNSTSQFISDVTAG